MNENYIVINGKKIELTEERIKALNLTHEPELRNPFKRVNGEYYMIERTGELCNYNDIQDSFDNRLYNNVNYFNDEAFAKQVALHQLLYRKLLKFAYDNGCEDTEEWNGSNAHWTIRCNDSNYDDFFAYSQERFKARDVYFSSANGANRAIDEVVKPFMKEHPEFVW